MSRRKKSEIMRQWLADNLYSQRDLAVAMGVAQKTVSNICTGASEPKDWTWKRFIALRRVWRKRRLKREWLVPS